MNMGNSVNAASSANNVTNNTSDISASTYSSTPIKNNNKVNESNSSYSSYRSRDEVRDQQFYVNAANEFAETHNLGKVNFAFSYDREPGTMMRKIINGQTVIPCDAKGNPMLHNDGRINKMRVLVYTNVNENNQIRVSEAVFTNEPDVESIFIDQRSGKETNLSEIMESQRRDTLPIELRNIKEIQVVTWPTLHREFIQDKKLELLYTAIARCANPKKSLVVNIASNSNLASAFTTWNDPVFFFDRSNKENGPSAYTVNVDKIRVSKQALHETLRGLFVFKNRNVTYTLQDSECVEVPVKIRDLANGKRKNNLHMMIGKSKLITQFQVTSSLDSTNVTVLDGIINIPVHGRMNVNGVNVDGVIGHVHIPGNSNTFAVVRNF